MKLYISFVSLIILVLALPLIPLTGCASLDPNADPIVVRVEQTIATAMPTFNVFLQLERSNEVVWGASVHRVAEDIRANGTNYVGSLDRVKRVYQSNRTPENKANLVTSLATVQSLITEAQANIARH
jgi:hypothetical protein